MPAPWARRPDMRGNYEPTLVALICRRLEQARRVHVLPALPVSDLDQIPAAEDLGYAEPGRFEVDAFAAHHVQDRL
jgi:hypothetical protein